MLGTYIDKVVKYWELSSAGILVVVGNARTLHHVPVKNILERDHRKPRVM
jgi:hypothetical protein